MKWTLILSLFLLTCIGIYFGYNMFRHQELLYMFDIILNGNTRENDSLSENNTNYGLNTSSIVFAPELTSVFNIKSQDNEATLVSNILTDRWRNIFNNSQDEFVYSAYRDGDLIRIIGAKLTRLQNSSAVHFCKIWYWSPNKTVQVSTSPVYSSLLPSNHGRKFSPAIYICPVSRKIDAIGVALAKTSDAPPFQQPILPVVSHVLNPRDRRKFSVCIAPLHNNYDRIKELVEWIELNKILGAQFFTFYNYSTSKSIKPVFSYYSTRGLAEVMTWDLPKAVREDIHYFGQMAAVNDCLYRNRYKTKYLAFFDLDEFIIPEQKQDFSWSDMLKRFPDASSYGFRNVFFQNKMKLNSTTDKRIETHVLTTLSRLQRDVFIFPMLNRSKCIVNPRKVETMGIHYVWKHKEGKTHTSGVKAGLLHHYRRRVLKKIVNFTIDEEILKYKHDLIKNVRNAWKNIKPHGDYFIT